MADLTKLTAELAGMKQKMVDRLVAQGDETIQPDDTMQTIVDHFDNLRTKIVNQDKEITANGEYTADEGYTGLGKVTVDVKAEPVPKYGVTIDALLGDVDENGVLQASTYEPDMNLAGVTNVAGYALYNKFYNTGVKSVSMPDLTQLTGNYSCYYTFAKCANIVSVRLANLEVIQGDYACAGMFDQCPNVAEINLKNLKQIGKTDSTSDNRCCSTMFQTNKALTEVDLGNLEYIYGGYACNFMFNSCDKIKTINLSKLKIIYGGNACISMFSGCAIQTIDLSSLETIYGYRACYQMFSGNRALESINLSGLRTVQGGQALYGFITNAKITTISFPSLTEIPSATAFQYAFFNVSALKEVHFRADMQATVEALTDYSKKFSADSTCTIYFDL